MYVSAGQRLAAFCRVWCWQKADFEALTAPLRCGTLVV